MHENKIIKGKEFEDLEQIIKEQVDLDTEWAELQDDPEPNSFLKIYFLIILILILVMNLTFIKLIVINV